MPYQVADACYSSPLEAAHAVASSQVGAIVEHGSAAYVVGLSSIDGNSITYALHPIGGGAAITSQIPFNAQPCGLLTYEDGLTIGWGIVGVWVAAYAVMFLARAVKGETGGNYGSES